MVLNVPVVRQIAWITLVPQMIFFGIFIYVYYLLRMNNPILYAGLSYLILSYLFRKFTLNNHRRGEKLVKKQNFKEAIHPFEKSIEFFSRYRWIDKYRYSILLSSSKMAFQEMALCNIAFCYSRINNEKKAKEYYEEVLKEFPNNGIATAALKMINAAERIQTN